MADLDDFFAKKDRKKNKGKQKFTTTDEIAKKLEETGKKLEKSKKEKPPTIPAQPQAPESEDQGNPNKEDDEWREFEEEKKDYSGLRIGKLQITEGEGDAGEGEGEEEQVLEENEAGEMVMRKKTQAGPWKMVNTQQQQQQQVTQEVPEPPVAEKRPESSSNTGPSTYRPPQLRNQPKDGAHASPRAAKSKAAPDINNEEFFPTLSASKGVEPSTGAWGRRRRDEGSFEEVRNSKSHSSRYADMANKMATTGGGPKLNLGNKFGALSQDQS